MARLRPDVLSEQGDQNAEPKPTEPSPHSLHKAPSRSISQVQEQSIAVMVDCGRLSAALWDRRMSSVAPTTTPRRSNAVLAAFSGPCLPLAAFGVALPVTLPEFYATFVGLELGMVAAVFMAVRLIDIVFDPFIGWGMDKTKTRFGRYRPWMAVSVPILMLAAWMMFVQVKPGAGAGF
ncbi:hypothetical protein LTR94_030088, partial [Friedmanniomyces endolithicus]